MEIIMTERIVYWSHLRWAEMAAYIGKHSMLINEEAAIYFVELPVHDATDEPWLSTSIKENVTVLTPHLPTGIGQAKALDLQKELLAPLLDTIMVNTCFIYFTPEAMNITNGYTPRLTVYDPEFRSTAIKYDKENIIELEKLLKEKADLILGKMKAKEKAIPTIDKYPVVSAMKEELVAIAV